MPFAWVEEDTEIGDGCVIFPYVSVMRGTHLGKNNVIHQNTVLAAVPQDFKYKGDNTDLFIGDDNTIRENVVINRATFPDGKTVIGNHNFLMEGVHVAHDTKIGNGNTFGYGTKIAGLCEIGDGNIYSSNVIQNGHTRVGDLVMVQAGTIFSKDIPPFIIAGGRPVAYGGPNMTMMEAVGIGEKERKHIANAYRLVFNGQTSVFDATLQIRDQIPESKFKQNIIKFLQSTKAGIISRNW